MVSFFLTIPQNKPQDTALSLKVSTATETIITNHQLLKAKNQGRVQISHDIFITVYPSHRNAPKEEKIPMHSLISLVVPAATLLSALVAFRVSGAEGWNAVFPSMETCPIVLKLTVWLTLVFVVAYEQSFYHFGSSGKSLAIEGNGTYIGLEVVVDDGFLAPLEDEIELNVHMDVEDPIQDVINQKDIYMEPSMEAITTSGDGAGVDPAAVKMPSSPARIPRNLSMPAEDRSIVPKSKSASDPPNVPGEALSATSAAKVSTPAPSFPTKSTENVSSTPKRPTQPTPTSPTKSAPSSVPFRFIRAEKGDVVAAKARWEDTLTWRKEWSMDTCLSEPHPNLKTIKENYPHYFHLRGKKNECCYYEQPAKMNISAIKAVGVSTEKLLKHYAMCCEYMWTHIENSEQGKSIYVIDLEGIGFRDFAGEVVDFVKQAGSFTAAHYPERSGSIFIINVPSWFSVIWNVVKPMVDDVTKQKIKILKYGKEAITKALLEKIDIESIPPEYGGRSMPLGKSPEEIAFTKHFEALNQS